MFKKIANAMKNVFVPKAKVENVPMPAPSVAVVEQPKTEPVVVTVPIPKAETTKPKANSVSKKKSVAAGTRALGATMIPTAPVIAKTIAPAKKGKAKKDK